MKRLRRLPRSNARRALHALGILALLGAADASGASSSASQAGAETSRHKVDRAVLEASARGEADFLVVLRDQADLSAARHIRVKQDRGRWVYETLRALAMRTQGDLVGALHALGVEHRAFWVVNMVQVRGDRAVVERLAGAPEVARIVADATLQRNPPRIDSAPPGAAPDLAAPTRNAAPDPPRVATVEWNVQNVNAPAVWAQGITGRGAVVGGMDTGYEWDHPALRPQYRGAQRGVVQHDYNWHDAIHSGGPLHCPSDSPEPCDGDLSGHGTHTMGTAVGDDGRGNQIGVAPDALWIGCRCWEQRFRTRLSYVTECLEWFIAPTTVQGMNADPAMAPHAITNSWVCDPAEGCTDPNVLLQVVENVRAAGIVVVAGAGNDGPECTTVVYPPAIYGASFSVGATTSTDAIAVFSSRGPVLVDGSARMKPDISAPGQNVRSSIPGGGFQGGWNGTSMATPHVSGAVALLVSAVPALAGQVEEIEDILRTSAVPLTTAEGCGGDSEFAVPNNTFGHGRLDVWAAYQEALARQTAVDDPETQPTPDANPLPSVSRLLPNRPNPFNPGTRIAFEVAAPAFVTLDVHDVAGRRVRRLLARAHAPGRHEFVWDGRNAAGNHVASGIYVIRFEADRISQSRRIVLLR